jgi:hypothetical protein
MIGSSQDDQNVGWMPALFAAPTGIFEGQTEGLGASGHSWLRLGTAHSGRNLPVLGGRRCRWKKAEPFENLFAQAIYHRFDSDRLTQHYGQEWDLSLTGKIGRLALLARYASYSAEGFSVNVRKSWLSVDWSFGRAMAK